MLVDETIPFKLGEGTEIERSVPWNKHASLGENHDQLFGALARLHSVLVDHTVRQGSSRMQNPMLITIECLWLTWCYAACDMERAFSYIDALTKRVEDLEAKLAALSSPDPSNEPSS